MKSATLVELVPRRELSLPATSLVRVGGATAATTTTATDAAEVESHRVLANAKLVEEAVKRCDTAALLVLVDASEVRGSLAQLYNDLWDACLMASKTTLDCRVVTGVPSTSSAAADSDVRVDVLMFAGDAYHASAVSRVRRHPVPSTWRVVSLADALAEEVAAPYVLYDNPSQRMPPLRRVALGGTFDRMHNGHKKLLSVARAVATELVVVGVTSSAMLASKKNADMIEPVDVRCEHVRRFFASLVSGSSDGLPRLHLEVIDDPWGPAITMPDLDGIVASSETLKGARLINEQRVAKKMNPLVSVIVQRSQLYTLSSTFVRGLHSKA